MTTEQRVQPLMLRRERMVTLPAAHLGDAPYRSARSRFGRLPLHHPAARPAPAAFASLAHTHSPAVYADDDALMGEIIREAHSGTGRFDQCLALGEGPIPDGLRERGVTPHVAQNTTNRSSAIDGRITRHAGYAVSQRVRKRVEEIFGWMKTVGGFRRTRYRGVDRAGTGRVPGGNRLQPGAAQSSPDAPNGDGDIGVMTDKRHKPGSVRSRGGRRTAPASFRTTTRSRSFHSRDAFHGHLDDQIPFFSGLLGIAACVVSLLLDLVVIYVIPVQFEA